MLASATRVRYAAFAYARARSRAVQQRAEPAGRFRHEPCKQRKARAGPARGLAVRDADSLRGLLEATEVVR